MAMVIWAWAAGCAGGCLGRSWLVRRGMEKPSRPAGAIVWGLVAIPAAPTVPALPWEMIPALGWTAFLTAIARVDHAVRLIPDRFVVAAAGCAIAATWPDLPTAPQMMAVAVSGVLLVVIRAAGRRRFRREALGLGDVKLGMVLALHLPPLVLCMVWCGAALAGLASEAFHRRRNGSGDPRGVPLGTWLCIAALFAGLLAEGGR